MLVSWICTAGGWWGKHPALVWGEALSVARAGLLPRVPTSGLRVGGGAGGGAAQHAGGVGRAIAAAGGGGGAEGAGGRRGHGPLELREVGHRYGDRKVHVPLLLQAQAQVVFGEVCGAGGGGGGWLRRDATRALPPRASPREGGREGAIGVMMNLVLFP